MTTLLAAPLRLSSYHPLAYLAQTRDLPFKERIKAILEIPYPADPLVEPEYVGLTFGEVALCKQAQFAALGSLDSIEFLLDRFIGKPQATNINLNANMNYADFLDGLAKNDPIDVTPESADTVKRESDSIS